jgi:hypothetical protein
MTMDGSFADRLLNETYSDDVVCELRLTPNPRDESREPVNTWISERLLGRLRHLGSAYELPLLGRIPRNGTTTYPEVQIPSLEDELAFIFEVVADPVLLHAIAPLRELLRLIKYEARGSSLTVEMP